MDIDELLSLADEETLQGLLGRPVMRLVRLLDPGMATPSRLRELLIGLRTHEGLLADPASRGLLLDLLPTADARRLAEVLGLPAGNPYVQLKSLKAARGSKREAALFDFFGVAPPREEQGGITPAEQGYAAGYGLFAHQRRAARRVRALLGSGSRRVLLHMPTGSGKTRTAMNIIADHLRANEPSLVIWLAYSEELCEQAAEEFARAWQALGDREVPIHRFWGARELDPQQVRDGLVVAGLPKLYSAWSKSIPFIHNLGARTSLVIIDEAHQAIAETYALTIEALLMHHETTGLLGLTATPGRTWADIDEDARLARFFDQRKVSLEIPDYASPIEYLVAEGYLARVKYEPLYYASGIELGEADLRRIASDLELPQRVLQQLAEDEQRNLRIVAKIEELAKRHRRTIVFAISVEHAEILAAVLRARGHEADAVTGQTPSTRRMRLINSFRNGEGTRILCNYGVLTTGFDAPQTSAAVIARPTKSLVLYSQMVGRAIRGVRAGGNAEAEIVTVVDATLPGFGDVAEAFSNWEDVWEKGEGIA